MSKITTMQELFKALRDNGMPVKLALAVSIVFAPAEMRRIVDTDDVAALRGIAGIGPQRAKAIIEALKGRIPVAMCKEKVRIPDPEMHYVPNLNVLNEDGTPKLTKNKVRRGKLVLKDGQPIKDVALKRYGPAMLKAVELMDGQMDKLVFTTISQVTEDWEDPIKAIVTEKYWRDIANGGIIVNGVKYVPVIMGTNANMKCQIHWLPEKIAQGVRAFCLCGAKIRKEQNIAKIEAYMGLMLPYTKDLLCGILKPEMEVFIPEWEHEHKGENRLINPDGSMKVQATFKVSEFDGQCYVELTDEIIEALGLTKKELWQLRKAIAKFKGGTLRAPLQKGCIVGNFPFHEVLRMMGVTTVCGKPLDKIAIIGDTTVFKTAIGDDGLFQKFEEYCASFKEMKHRFGLLLENHGVRQTYLPAQQLQAAFGCDTKFVEQGAREEVEYLKKAQDPKVASTRYLPKAVAEIAQVDERIAGTYFSQEMIKTGYTKELQQALSGASHANSLTGFVIKDPIAHMEWIAYLEGVRKELPKGVVKKHQVLAPMGGYTGKAVASRNPVIANYGLVIVDVIEETGTEWDWAIEGLDFLIVGINDDLCKRLRMDHDGDKIRLTTAEWFVNAVKSLKKMPFAEWETFGEAVKNMCTAKDVREFFATRTVTPQLGSNVDFAGRVIAMGAANGIVSLEEANWIFDYMMNKGTDVKQGADGSSCEGEAGEIWKKLKKGVKDLMDKGVPKFTRPQAYGKYIKEGKFPDAKDVEPNLGKDNLSVFHGIVKAEAPTSIPMKGDFPTEDVLKNKIVRTIKGLVGSGSAKNNFEDAGLFNRLVQTDRSTFEQMGEREKETGGYADYMAFRKQVALDEFQKFADEHEVTMAQVYDCITAYVFDVLAKQWYAKKTTEKQRRWYMVLAITYFAWFGDEMVETYCANKALGCLKTVAPMAMDDVFDF